MSNSVTAAAAATAIAVTTTTAAIFLHYLPTDPYLGKTVKLFCA
jgi:hypothetical protein